jgi:hypothetical protein
MTTYPGSIGVNEGPSGRAPCGGGSSDLSVDLASRRVWRAGQNKRGQNRPGQIVANDVDDRG